MSSPRAGHRLWFLVVVALLAAAAIGIVRLQPELERNIKGWITIAISGLALVLVLLWFALLSRFSWRLRLITLAMIGVAGFGFSKSVRIAGTTNSIGFPKLTWKWTRDPAPLDAAPKLAAGVVNTTDIPDVPQFFGPNRDGVVTGARLARDWAASPPRQLWRRPVGAGWASFAVVGGRALTQEQRGEAEAVTCYDVRSGEPVWVQSHAAHFHQWQAGEGPHATPTIDRGRVFAIGATGILECLDAATGARVWSRNVLRENGCENLEYGVSASPLVFDETVVVTGGQSDSPTVLAYRREDGQPLWRANAGRASYASPVLATLAGRRVVLSLNAESLTAHDPANGDELLRFPFGEKRVPKGAQPVVIGGDRVFLSAGYGTGCVLIQVKAEAGKLAATQLWKTPRMKNQFNSVAVHDGFLYGLDDSVLACVEIATGERRWKDGRYGSGQSLIVDDLILVQSEPGFVALAEARPDAFRELGRIEALSSKTWNHPVLAGRYLLVRNDREAACYELAVSVE
jgi:outer membrane protein assembly factor BamB